MSPSAVVAILATAAVLALSASVVAHRRNRGRLLRRLEVATQELQSLQTAFSRFAPDPIIEKIIAQGVHSYGEKKIVTVLFADLVGFTALSESVEPTVLVRILNGYFERMSRAIVDNRGYVSTFIGDGLLAFFGVLEPNPWQADDAAHAALAMQAALEDYGRELAGEGLPSLSMGIGLHRGTGVAGLVGSRDLMQFAFVGRTVNVAARVQDLTRGEGARILVTDAVRDSLAPQFRVRKLAPASVKGVERPLVLFSLDGTQEAAAGVPGECP